MAERVLRGVPASPGVAAGRVVVLGVPAADGAARERLAEADRPASAALALGALTSAAADLEAVAARLRADGRGPEADIVATGALMALDPALQASVEAGVLAHGRPGPQAIVAATEEHAALIASLGDATLAARADDVRSLGRRAAAIAAGAPTPATASPEDPVVLVASDLGPADVAEHAAGAAGIALAQGSSTAHAAIVARSLGVPMVVGLGDELLRAAEGLVIDGDAGEVVLAAAAERLTGARTAQAQRRRGRDLAARDAHLGAVTGDGRRLSVLANVAGPAEWAVAVGAGAEGIGLLRTELAVLEWSTWPGEDDHRRALRPVLRAVGTRPATVRVLDLGGDKAPPFLSAGEARRGIDLLLAHPEAFAAQLRAILAEAADSDLRVLLPLVGSAADVEAARVALEAAVAAVEGGRWPKMGAMVETPEAARIAGQLARGCDVLSIGTNDLSHATLGTARFGGGEAPAHHPRVLAAIAQTARAAREASIPLEVCGEAASDPTCMPLLVGLGVDELSVGAARVGTVRAWVRALDAGRAEELATRALACSDAAAVADLMAPTAARLRGVA